MKPRHAELLWHRDLDRATLIQYIDRS